LEKESGRKPENYKKQKKQKRMKSNEKINQR
jgi:hypothetical protein